MTGRRLYNPQSAADATERFGGVTFGVWAEIVVRLKAPASSARVLIDNMHLSRSGVRALGVMKMLRSDTGLDVELRMPPKLAWGAFVLIGSLLYVNAEVSSLPWEDLSSVFSLCVVLFGAAIVGWLLDSWHSMAGRWSAIVLSAGVVCAGAVILEMPAVLLLAPLPVALATPMVGVHASVLVALAISVGLALAANHGVASATAAVASAAQVGVWATLGIMFTVHWQTHQLISWLGDYFEQSQRYVAQARGQREELEQALESYASLNRQLALANERATALRAAAEEAQRTKATFVANVSHEFRTPLNMIIGLVDLMMQAPATYAVVPSPEMREDLEVVHRNCEHLSNMVNDVLDLTRVEAGRLALRRERVDLGDIIHSSVAVVRPLLDKKQLNMTVNIPSRFPQVYCDRTRIQQVVLNLISNAARFTDTGGIDVVVEEDGYQVTVSVRDTGMGINPEDVDVIFQPFEQGKLWHGKGGSGLGLSLSKRFVELHGGEMHLESTVGVGTVFRFTLPISPPLEHLTHPGSAIQTDWIWHESAFNASRQTPTGELTKPCIVVHDEGGDLWPWLDHYQDQAELVVVKTVEELRSAMVARSAHALLLGTADPQALLDVTRDVQGLSDGTPIIACSIPRSLDRARVAGAVGHLLKPVRRSDLELAIGSLGQHVRRILVVDDDPDVLKLFGRMLKILQADVDVVTVTNGSEALLCLRQDPPDLMLLDVVMPGVDGWQVLEEMRTDDGLPFVPTYLISAQDSVDHTLNSTHMLITIDNGIPLSKVLACSCQISELILSPAVAPCLVPG